jgi:hypothetical protein
MSYSDLNSTPNYGGFTAHSNVKCNSNNLFYGTNQNTHNNTLCDSSDVLLAGKLSRSSTSALMNEFFSDVNIKRLQKMIRNEVHKRSFGRFKLSVDQDKQDLLVAMERIYKEHGRNLPTQIIRQTKILNKKLIDDIIPEILTTIKQYYGYIKDISTPIEPIARPMNVNNAGRQELPSITTLWQDR